MTQPKPDLIPVIDAEIISPSQWAAKPKTDEQRLAEAEGDETAELFLKTLEEMIYVNSITEACAASGISERTFHRVKGRTDAAWQLYTRTRKARADYRFDNLLTKVEGIADPQRAKVILEAEKWTIGKMNRQMYGDDPITVQGPDGGAIKHEMEHRSGVLEELSRRLAKKAKALAREKKETGGEGEYGFENEGGEGDGNNPPLILPSRT